MRNVSVSNAIGLGCLIIIGPGILLFIVVPILVLLAISLLSLPSWLNWLSFPLGFVIAWSWWSFILPKWRLWALRRVQDIALLYQKAIAAGLMWPRGHFFEKTEFKSLAHTIQEQEIELLYYLRIFQESWNNMPKDTEEALNLLVTCLNTPSSIHERHATAEKLQNLLMNAPEESDDNHYFTMSFLMRRISSYLTNLEKVGMS